jgi:ribosomal-protein-alanine N-acetyltransferase
MATSPILVTKRARLEPFAVERHLSERYVSWLNDPEITRYSEQRHHRHTLDSCRQYASSFPQSPNHFWALLARDPTLGHIGNLNAFVSEANAVADIGILIGERSAQGRGYATEAWLAVCDFLLRVAALRKITAGTLAVNTAMLRLMERVSMQEDGRRVRQHLWNGQEVDIVHVALFREDWLRRFPVAPLWE